VNVKKNSPDINKLKEDTARLRESQKLAMRFAIELQLFIENNLLKIKNTRTPFSKIVQQTKSDVPLYYSGAMWRTHKKLPSLSIFVDKNNKRKVEKNSKVLIGPYIYILFTGTGFRVGFYLNKIYKEDSGASPFNRDKERISIKSLLDVLENGARIPLTRKVRAFYFAVMRYYKKRILNKYRLGRPYWKIPRRPFWNTFVRKFQSKYGKDYEISTNKQIPYSVFIRRLNR
jgi:hypothetical protein